MKRIFENVHYFVDVDFAARRIEMERTSVPFEGIPSVLSTLERLMEAVRAAGAEDFLLLIDSTQAPAPPGPRYEKGFSKLAQFLSKHFERIAVVVSSREAALKEFEKAPGENIDFFTNRAAARNALSQPSLLPPRP